MKAYTTGRSLVGIFRACSVSVLLTTIGSGVASSDESVRQQFVVFDGLLSPGKPDLRPTGLVPIGGSGNLWRPGHSHDDVDDAGVRSAIDMYRGRIKIFYIDIENWPLQGVAPSVRTANIEKLTRLADVTRGSATGMRIGFYGIMPGITYWPLVSRTGREPQYRDWKETNKELDTLATHVDVVFPSVYTFYDDRSWKPGSTVSRSTRFSCQSSISAIRFWVTTKFRVTSGERSSNCASNWRTGWCFGADRNIGTRTLPGG